MDVKIYTAPDSPQCKKLKEWLKKKKIAFQDLDTTESDTYRNELIEKSSQVGVPVIDIDGKIIVGFQENELEAVFRK